MRILEVRGRKSGNLYCLPVDLLEYEGKLYLVSPRGRGAWVQNAEACREVVLRRGSAAHSFAVHVIDNYQKPPILAAYLARFKKEVQRFFPVRAGSDLSNFVELADRYPVFELIHKD